MRGPTPTGDPHATITIVTEARESDPVVVAAPATSANDVAPEPLDELTPAERMLALRARALGSANATRSRTLLLTEIQALESLFMHTARADAVRPRLAERLVESYLDLALRPDSDEPDQRERNAKITASALGAAGKYARLLAKEYPNMDRADRMLFWLGIAREASGAFNDARRAYLDLVSAFPASNFAAAAYFAFGELFASEARAEPTRWSFAVQAYREAAAYTGAPIVPEALLALGHAYERQGDREQARTAYLLLLRNFTESAAAKRAPRWARAPAL